MPFGIYYSQRDWYHPDDNPTDWLGEKHEKYNDYQFKAVRELLTKYGKVDIPFLEALMKNGKTARARRTIDTMRQQLSPEPGSLLDMALRELEQATKKPG